MNKKETILYNLGELKKVYMNNEDKKWNLRALSNAIHSISKFDEEIISGNQLKEKIKGVGEKIAKKIDEILLTGTLKELPELNYNDNNNKSLEKLLLITGVGNVRAKKWISMGIIDINTLKQAIQDKVITTTHHIDLGIKYYEDFQKKIPKEEIDEIKILLNNAMKKIDNQLIFEICGSYRRGLPESGDIDILVSHPNYIQNISEKKFLDKIIKELTKSNFIIDNLTSKGATKFMGVCKKNQISRRIDIRVVNYQSYFTSIIYFTGSKEFNIFLRNKALAKNYTLNEYSLTNLHTNEDFSIESEEHIFKILETPYLKPNERNLF